MVGSSEKAATLARLGLGLVWGLRGVHKREVRNKRGINEEVLDAKTANGKSRKFVTNKSQILVAGVKKRGKGTHW